MITEGEYSVEMGIFVFSNASLLFGSLWWRNGCIVVL